MRVRILAAKSIELLEAQINAYLRDTQSSRDKAEISITASKGERDSSPTVYALVVTD